MADEAQPTTPAPVDIARAIAIANGHPDPDTFVARFEQALDGKPSAELPDYQPVDDPAPVEGTDAQQSEQAPAQQEG